MFSNGIYFRKKYIQDLYMVYLNTMSNYINITGIVRSSGNSYILIIFFILTLICVTLARNGWGYWQLHV